VIVEIDERLSEKGDMCRKHIGRAGSECWVITGVENHWCVVKKGRWCWKRVLGDKECRKQMVYGQAR